MRKINRTPKPSYLSNSQQLGKEYEQQRLNRKKGEKDNFSWNGLYDLLLTDLSSLTQQHCSYCDLAQVRRGQVSPTIDHFRPKTKFPLLAYSWDNLFLCCTECQKRIAKFDELLLKPDTFEYNFDDYFIINTINGDIEPNKAKSKENQKRAKLTIKIFKFNENDRPKYRLEALENYRNTLNPILDDFSYRFFIERSINS